MDHGEAARAASVPQAEFKLEPVRRMQERRAEGASLSQIGRELDVRSDMPWVWAQEAEARAGAAPRDVLSGQGSLPTEQEEPRRLQREVTRLS